MFCSLIKFVVALWGGNAGRGTFQGGAPGTASYSGVPAAGPSALAPPPPPPPPPLVYPPYG